MTNNRPDAVAEAAAPRLTRAHVLRYERSIPPLDLVAELLANEAAPVFLGWTTPRVVVVAWPKYLRAGPSLAAKIPGRPRIQEYNACADPDHLVAKAVKTLGHPPRPGRGHKAVPITDLWSRMDPRRLETTP